VRRAPACVALALLAAGCAELAPVPEPQAAIVVDAAAARQTYFGLGATHSHAVLTDGRMTDDQWRRTVEAITEGVGARTGTAPHPVEAAGGAPGAHFSRPLGFAGLDSLFSRYERHAPDGVGDMVPFAGINTRWAHRWLNDLKSADYARYLDEIAGKALATVADWTRRTGREPELLQLWNEPLTGNRELHGGTMQDMLAILKHTGRRLREAGYSRVRFLAGNEETVTATLADLRAITQDAEARGYVGAIGYHAYPYGSDYSYIPRLLARAAPCRRRRKRGTRCARYRRRRASPCG
jgi:O-glycosyl hydrolase